MADTCAASEPVLAIRDLSVSFRVAGRELNVITEQSLEIGPGEAFGLVGESGSGKTTLALATMGFLGRTGRSQGQILLEGENLAAMTEGELRTVRGRRVAMIYQDPMSSLNPLMTIGAQLMEVPMVHGGVGRNAAHELALGILGEVDLPDPEWLMARYPHQLSGGQQQRVVIAMALISRPALLIMDEPTTALDVTVEAEVLNLVKELRRRHGMAILFISHNLRTVAQVCDRVAVMYAGEIVEEGPIRTIFEGPRHPYTIGLFDCLPTVGWRRGSARLRPMPGKRRRQRSARRAADSQTGANMRYPNCAQRADPAARGSGAGEPSREVRKVGRSPEPPDGRDGRGLGGLGGCGAARPDVSETALRAPGCREAFSQARGLFGRLSKNGRRAA